MKKTIKSPKKPAALTVRTGITAGLMKGHEGMQEKGR